MRSHWGFQLSWLGQRRPRPRASLPGGAVGQGQLGNWAKAGQRGEIRRTRARVFLDCQMPACGLRPPVPCPHPLPPSPPSAPLGIPAGRPRRARNPDPARAGRESERFARCGGGETPHPPAIWHCPRRQRSRSPQGTQPWAMPPSDALAATCSSHCQRRRQRGHGGSTRPPSQSSRPQLCRRGRRRPSAQQVHCCRQATSTATQRHRIHPAGSSDGVSR